MHFTGNDAFSLNLDAPLREDYAIEAPGDDNAIAFNLPFDPSTVTQYHGLLGNDVALNTSVDAKRPCYRERPFKVNPLINEACPFFADPGFCSRTGPLPRHGNPPKRLHPLYRLKCGSQRSLAMQVSNEATVISVMHNFRRRLLH